MLVAVRTRQWKFTSELTYAGLIVVIFWSLPDLINSLLMKRPRGWDHFLPLGAVSSASIFLSGNVCEKDLVGDDEKVLARSVGRRRNVEERVWACFRHNVGERRSCL